MINNDSRTDKRKLGDLGESIACNFLLQKGFEIVERNYLRKWGELDIVAKKKQVYHFVEVKSVQARNVNRVTDGFRPEDNMHPWKLKRLGRAMQTYVLEKRLDNEYQLDLITVKIDMETRRAKVELIENIII